MIYRVTAKFIKGKEKELYTLLTDGTVAAQKPDGREIITSMKEAVIDDEGRVMFTETCFCDTPLKHERETVYDKFFEDIQTEPVDEHEEYEGQFFFTYLKSFE